MTLVLHGIANCDTVKKAKTWLEGRDVAFSFRDYKKSPPSRAELEAWSDTLGWEALVNRQGTTFRRLSDVDKADLSRDRAIALMLAQPSLIRRPLVERDGRMLHVGFRPHEWEAAFA